VMTAPAEDPPVAPLAPLPIVAVEFDDPPPCKAAAAPPAAAAPTIARITMVFDDFDFATGSAFVCVNVALAAWPRQDAVTRTRYWPGRRFGLRPRPVARPSGPVCIVRLRPLPENVPLGPDAGSRNVTVAPVTGAPVASSTWTTGSWA